LKCVTMKSVGGTRREQTDLMIPRLESVSVNMQ
jgi:hypothetical protein